MKTVCLSVVYVVATVHGEETMHEPTRKAFPATIVERRTLNKRLLGIARPESANA